ncbi:3176_t:CDS:2 [Gigaspora rosea]|nr:3176_t:CDS:2 [Gigaspora rosea]
MDISRFFGVVGITSEEKENEKVAQSWRGVVPTSRYGGVVPTVQYPVVAQLWGCRPT